MKNVKKCLITAALALCLPVSALASSASDNSALGDAPVPIQTQIKKSYLTFTSDDGNFRYKFDGRVMLDFGFVENDKKDDNINADTELRRVRFGIKTKMFDVWEGEFDLDFAENEVDIKDMWMAYTGVKNTIFRIGNHKPAFSMNEVTSSRVATFMEVATPVEAFGPGRHIGASATNWGKYYFAGATFLGDTVGEKHAWNDDDEQLADISYGFATRLVGRPFVSDNGDMVVALGLNLLHQKPDAETDPGDQDEIRFSARSESHLVDYKYLKTKKIKNVDYWDVYGLEFAGKYKKFSWQAEYLKTDVSVNDGTPEPEFDGWYAYVSYFLTDDQRPYNLDDGEFGGILPNGKYGAWEVAVRLSNLDLNDSSRWGDDLDDNGGEATAVTLALNWYINNNFMIKANYIHTEYDEFANGGGDFTGDDTQDTVAMRFQFVF